jgi:two-component system cell cycle sensor histidine kinase/response regulator CckA
MTSLPTTTATTPADRRPSLARRPTAWLALGLGFAFGLALLQGVAQGFSAATLAIALAGAGAAMAGWLALRRSAVELPPDLMAELVRTGPVGNLLTDADGRILFANRAYGALFEGRSRPLADELAHDHQASRRLAEAAARVTAGDTVRLELPVDAGAGRVRWFKLTGFPAAGRPGNQVWHIDDTTEWHELQSTLEAERAALSDFLDNAPVGFLSADRDGRLLRVNKTLAAWLGRDAGAGRLALSDIFAGDTADLLREVAPDQPPLATRAELLGAGGKRVPVAVTHTVASGDEAAWHTRTVVRDLSAEMRWESALKVAEAQFRHIFDVAPLPVLTLDRDDAVLEGNDAFRTLAAGQALEGRSFIELVDPNDRAEVSRVIADTRGQRRAGTVEVRLGPALGRRMVQLFVGDIGGAGAAGEPNLLLHLVDTTDQRNLEVQFAQSQKMQAVGQLAGGVAHDFNNLLTAIIGHCDLLLQRARPGDEAFPDIMQVKQNANRAANLVRQLLAFSRQQTLRPKVLSITDMLADLSHLLRRLLGENMTLEMNHARDLGLVRVDQNQFEQVVINLAVNARDAMPGGGTLTITTRNVSYAESERLGHELMPAGEYVLIEVADTGKGIAKEDLGKIFEPFFTTKEPGSGTGLGLSTVYGIIKQTGGFIFPVSEVGAGTTFYLYLPRHQAAEGTETAAAAGESVKPVDLTGKGTILLVEDEEAVRVFAARALRGKGYTVLEADTGVSALEVLESLDDGIDLLISDVVMPQMDGPTLLRHVREMHPDLKVIFISGYAEDAFRRNLDPASRFQLLPKPFSLKQLAAKVKEVLAGEAA